MRAKIAVLLLTSVILSGYAQAQEFGVRITGQITHSDNVRRAELDTAEEDIGSIELAIGAAKDSGKLQYDFNGQYRNLSYRNDTFEAEPIAALDLDATWEIADDRFLWQLEDSFGQLTTDPFEAATPGNREDSNVFTTGPDFIFQFGRQIEATLRGRYVDQYFEISTADNTRVSGEVEFTRILGEDRSVSLVLLSDALDFDDMSFVDFDRRAAFIRYASTIGASSVTFDIGVNEIDDGVNTSSSEIFRIVVEREPSANTSLRLDLSQSYSDSGSRLAATSSSLGSIGSSQNTIANGVPLELAQGTFFLTRRMGRSTLTGSLEYNDEDFLGNLAEDRIVSGVGLNYEFSVSPVSTVGIQGAFQTVAFSSVQRDDDDTELSVFYSRSIGRSLVARIAYSDTRRRSTQDGRNYDEARVFLSVAYSMGRLFSN